MSAMHKTLLLVEDNPNDEILTLRGLRRSKIANEIIVARDGLEALDYLFGTGGHERVIPALVLLDMNLPKLNGLDVLRRIRSDERTKTIPVVILTSSQQERDVVESYQLGCNSYVCKPLDFDQFIKAANELSMYWLILNEPPAVEDPASSRKYGTTQDKLPALLSTDLCPRISDIGPPPPLLAPPNHAIGRIEGIVHTFHRMRG